MGQLIFRDNDGTEILVAEVDVKSPSISAWVDHHSVHQDMYGNTMIDKEFRLIIRGKLYKNTDRIIDSPYGLEDLSKDDISIVKNVRRILLNDKKW